MFRRFNFSLLAAAPLLCLMQIAAAHGQTQPLVRTIEVPLDHRDRGLGAARLSFELGAPFDKSKPVVLVIADGQQFYVRRGAARELQQKLFGDAFNVVGIIPRGGTPEFVKAALDPSGRPDWARAWRIFNADQWVADIEAVRRSLVGDEGGVMLYGRSGGAYLIHQYLSRHGTRVARAFTQSPVNPLLNRELGIAIDRFWEELGAQDRGLQGLLRKALARDPGERLRMLVTLQRQHFFIPAERIAPARAELIRALAEGDAALYERARKEYQADEVLKLYESAESIPQVVRVLELIHPSGAFRRLGGEAVYPLLESQHHFQKPLLALLEAGTIPAPSFDLSAAHRLDTEVFILAGRRDEAVDYRTSIALAYSYPRHQLFIADDNHVFSKLNEAGLVNRLLQGFLGSGPGSTEYQQALAAAAPYRWSE
ncbi:MAG TPA: alpha/beta hydrolase [Pyrinomonadaceae bacterium]|nr:alpha/beta hydrolase [Pyrinomonadaceae bacterium]